MSFADILRLSLRNLREARLRAVLTTMGVIVGVAVIVTMVSFGLGLQRNTVSRFRELDLFNEITVYGKNLSEVVEKELNRRARGPDDEDDEGPEREGGRREGGPAKTPQRPLDDAALADIARLPGVASVEPNISFTAFVRLNGKARRALIGGALVPNPASRFKNFAAGQMIAAPDADEVVVDERFLREFGYEKPADAIGQRLELLAPPERKGGEEGEEGTPNFFGIPLEAEDAAGAQADALVARSFTIVGVLANELSGVGRRFRGIMPAYNVYVPLGAARAWKSEHGDELGEVALQLARESGALGADEEIGYGSAVVRVADPVVLSEVRGRINELGFSSFSIMDQLEQLRTVFLIINAALGLLGGISLLVASFGIANTMIMSILERTREIGIMKAVGAEDREIKLIFFVEAGVIGLTGGVAGALLAWGIDALANRLAYRFILRPQGASYIDFFALPPPLWLGAILFAVVVSVVAALYPAARAARIDPVKALRHD
ncbi:MAG TPA: FtsX-like permease family protein [Pyrinomonadaceae bacterium]|jgi:ABC-type lipoprotein release transport system permease subunit